MLMGKMQKLIAVLVVVGFVGYAGSPIVAEASYYSSENEQDQIIEHQKDEQRIQNQREEQRVQRQQEEQIREHKNYDNHDNYSKYNNHQHQRAGTGS